MFKESVFCLGISVGETKRQKKTHSPQGCVSILALQSKPKTKKKQNKWNGDRKPPTCPLGQVENANISSQWTRLGPELVSNSRESL